VRKSFIALLLVAEMAVVIAAAACAFAATYWWLSFSQWAQVFWIVLILGSGASAVTVAINANHFLRDVKSSVVRRLIVCGVGSVALLFTIYASFIALNACRE
jgi:hypothetical protein